MTITLFSTRHLPGRDAVGYVVAQSAGALLAGLLLRALWPGSPGHLGSTLPTVGGGTAVVYEAILTAVFIFAVMSVGTDTRAVGGSAAIAVSATVALDILVGGLITGGSMNPARSLGPAVASGELGDLWVYLIAPVGGAIGGALAYQFIRGTSTSSTVTPVADQTSGA